MANKESPRAKPPKRGKLSQVDTPESRAAVSAPSGSPIRRARAHPVFLPLSFLGWYIVLIPAFALLYYGLPRHFYHSTVKHELALRRDGEAILQDLAKCIVGDLKRFHKGNEVRIESCIAYADMIRLRRIQCEEGEVSFEMTVNVVTDNAEESRRGALMVTRASLRPLSDRHPWPVSVPFPSGKRDVVVRLDPTVAEHKYIGRFDFRRLFVRRGIVGGEGERASMDLHDELFARIRDYAKAHEGIPGSTTGGRFCMMLYFSAVTQTTLGFGDIVPISGLSRYLAALQCILGVAVAGFFLISVGRMSRR